MARTHFETDAILKKQEALLGNWQKHWANRSKDGITPALQVEADDLRDEISKYLQRRESFESKVTNQAQTDAKEGLEGIEKLKQAITNALQAPTRGLFTLLAVLFASGYLMYQIHKHNNKYSGDFKSGPQRDRRKKGEVERAYNLIGAPEKDIRPVQIPEHIKQIMQKDYDQTKHGMAHAANGNSVNDDFRESNDETSRRAGANGRQAPGTTQNNNSGPQRPNGRANATAAPMPRAA